MGKSTDLINRLKNGRALYLAGAAFIVLATLTAYIPALHGQFIWDDDRYVSENPLLVLPDGLQRIWTSLDSPSQYFPLVYTMFRFERGLWGLDTFGFHLMNVLLHCLNALLVWVLLRRLNIRGAWLAAAIFALHPVNVESVAWITERKNTLSTVLYLSALLTWISFVDRPSRRSYALTFLLYVLALFAKTTACTLAAPLVLILWLKDRRIDLRRAAQILPFVVWGAAMGALSIWWEHHHQGTVGMAFDLSPIQRILLASRALWFYAGKLIWPSGLAFSYPRWQIDPGNLLGYGWVILSLAALAGLWSIRRTRKGPVVAALFFAGALAPMLGFVSLYTFRYSYVADHYQYVACIGPIAVVAAILSRRYRPPRFDYAVRYAVPALMLPVLWLLTWNQAHAYKDLGTLWADTLTKNPSSFLAHAGLGAALSSGEEYGEAIRHYDITRELSPDSVEPYIGLGTAYAGLGDRDRAIEEYNHALALNPIHPEAHYSLGVVLAEKGDYSGAVEHYMQALKEKPYWPEALNNLGTSLVHLGKVDDGVKAFNEALVLDPGNLQAHLNLGVVLIQQNKLDRGIEELRTALQIAPDLAEGHYNLSFALSASGKPDEAKREMDEAVRLNPALAPMPSRKANPAEEHHALAMQYQDQGRTEDAIREYREAIRLDPRYAEPHVNLGALLVESGKIREGIRQYQAAMRLQPSMAQVHNNLAIALYYDGRYAEAWKEVGLSRKYGVEPHPGFIEALSAKMPEPR